MNKMWSVIALISVLAFSTVAESRSYSSDGGFRSSSSSFSSRSFSAPLTSRFSSGSIFSKPSTLAPSRFSSGSTFNQRPAQTTIRPAVPSYGYHPFYSGYGYHPYYGYHSSWYNPGGNFWMWMWIFDRHSQQPVVINQQGGATASYAPPGPSFTAILVNLILLAILAGVVVWIIRLVFKPKF